MASAKKEAGERTTALRIPGQKRPSHHPNPGRLREGGHYHRVIDNSEGRLTEWSHLKKNFRVYRIASTEEMLKL